MSLVINRLCATTNQVISCVYTAVAKVIRIAIDALMELVKNTIYLVRKCLTFSVRVFIHGTSVLWTWRIQAIYFRIEIILSEIFHYFKHREAAKKEKVLQKQVVDQANLIDQLKKHLDELLKELTIHRKEVLDGYEFQIETAIKCDDLAKQVEKEKMETFRLKLKAEIQNSESEFRELFTKIMTCYEKVTASTDFNISFELRYVDEILIPRWKNHLEALNAILQNLLEEASDCIIPKQILQKIIELSARPLTLTQMVLRISTLVHTKSKSPVSFGIEMKEIDPKVYESVNKLKDVLESANKMNPSFATCLE